MQESPVGSPVLALSVPLRSARISGAATSVLEQICDRRSRTPQHEHIGIFADPHVRLQGALDAQSYSGLIALVSRVLGSASRLAAQHLPSRDPLLLRLYRRAGAPACSSDAACSGDARQALHPPYGGFPRTREIEALLEAPDTQTRAGRRDRSLLLVAVQTGLRASKLIHLCCQDVQPGPGAHLRCQGTGASSSPPLSLFPEAVSQATGEPSCSDTPTRHKRRTRPARESALVRVVTRSGSSPRHPYRPGPVHSG